MDVPVPLERSIDISDNIARNCEPESFTAARLGKNKCVDSDHTTPYVHQGATAISWIDGRIRLYEDPRIVLIQLAGRRAHDTHADRVVHTQRAPESQHQLSLLYVLGVVELQWLEAFSLDF